MSIFIDSSFGLLSPPQNRLLAADCRGGTAASRPQTDEECPRHEGCSPSGFPKKQTEEVGVCPGAARSRRYQTGCRLWRLQLPHDASAAAGHHLFNLFAGCHRGVARSGGGEGPVGGTVLERIGRPTALSQASRLSGPAEPLASAPFCGHVAFSPAS